MSRYGTTPDYRRDAPNTDASDYAVQLNFLALTNQDAEAVIFRKRRVDTQEERPTGEVMGLRLPDQIGDKTEWLPYWISFDQREGFEQITIPLTRNVDLGARILLHSLSKAAAEFASNQYEVPESAFISEVRFNCRAFPEGTQQLVVQPYYLKATRQLGYLLDFHFRLGVGVRFDRKVQQLSLSLDKNFRRNLDYYVDRVSKVEEFRRGLEGMFQQVRVPGSPTPLQLEGTFTRLPAERLRSKIYVFQGNKESRSQFSGLRDYGPLTMLEGPPRLLFVFREQDR